MRESNENPRKNIEQAKVSYKTAAKPDLYRFGLVFEVPGGGQDRPKSQEIDKKTRSEQKHEKKSAKEDPKTASDYPPTWNKGVGVLSTWS